MKVLVVALLALPLTAVADPQGAGAPAPPKNAPVDKKAPSQEPAKPEAPSKDKPVDKPAGEGSGSASPHKPVKSPPRHA